MTRLAAPVLALLLLLAAALPAFAHAQLLSSTPAANAVLAQAPQTLTLVFNEPVSPLVISLIAPDGTATDLTEATTSGEMVNVHLPSGMNEGTHVLSWRVVSVDAHPIAGSLIFSLGNATGTAFVMAESSHATSILLWASKTVLFMGLFLGLGGAIFALAAPLPKDAKAIIMALNGLGLIAAPISLGLHGSDALGLDPTGLFNPAAWSAGYSTSYGLTAMLLLAGFALAFISLFRVSLLALIAWGLAAFALAISGHAGAAEPQWLTRGAVILHIGGIIFWAGALLPLFVWMREPGAEADKALAQFSRFIPFAVAPIIVSGGVLAFIQMGPPSASWITPYGMILAAKLGLLIALFGLALWNRFRLTQPALLGDSRARAQLRKSVLCEIVLVLVIFALAAGWRFTPPPRAIAAAEVAQAALETPAYTHAMDEKIMAEIEVTPGRAGPVDIEINLMDMEGEIFEPMSVDLTLSAPDLGIEPIKIPANFRDGLWRVDGQTLPLPGLWELVLDIRIDRFTLARIGTDITIN